MVRFLLRFIGLLCLAATFILVVYDGTKSIADNNLYFTSGRGLWELINAGSLAALKPLLEPYAGGTLWDPVTVSVLAAPASVLFALFGIVFILLGRRKKPLIGYERA
jgi:peptidoglycan/LPS O-acetylase OafA/YrhL